jgi:uncharacterized protein YaeQ
MTWAQLMALNATIYNFDVELAGSDRAVYESLACVWRVTRRDLMSI